MPTDAAATTAASAEGAAEDALPLLCPGCGYDLRGSVSNRCSECGLEIDRSALAVSRIPWVHRKQIGGVRAFVQTVWVVTRDRRSIRDELTRPHDLNDARAFQRRVAIAAAVGLCCMAATVIAVEGLRPIAVHPDPTGMGIMPYSGPEQDLLVPWCSGATNVIVIPLYLILLAAYWTGVGRAVMRLLHYPPQHRERGQAMAIYAAAPLAWLLPIGILCVFLYALRHFGGGVLEELRFQAASTLLALVGSAVAGFAGLGMTIHRLAEWHTRAHHGGAARYAAGAAEVLGRMLLGLLLFLGIVPWCVGLGWIIFDSIG